MGSEGISPLNSYSPKCRMHFLDDVLLPPAYVVRGEGNVLTRVCLSVHRGGGGYPYPIMLCNITQNAMGQLGGTLPGLARGGTLPGPAGGYPARSSRGRTLPGGYPARSSQGGTLPGPARGVPCLGEGYPARSSRGLPCPGGTLPGGVPS